MDDDMSTPKAAVEPKPGRRRLLKALAGAGGVFATGALLPERWTRPVVESIIVPAHAQATGVLAQSYAGSSSFAIGSARPPAVFAQRILNGIIPTASAADSQVNVCLQPGADTVVIQIYACHPLPAKSTGNAPLSAGGAFKTSLGPWWTSVSGTLEPAGGTVDLVANVAANPISIPVFADEPCNTTPLCNVMSSQTEIFTDTA